jgi:signal transduction histidine kinase
MKVTPAAAIVSLLVVLLTWLSLCAFNPEAELFDRAFAELDRFAMCENALYRDVFTARAGSLRNYDPIVEEIDRLRLSIERLRTTAAIDAETTAAVDRLAASIERQEELVEQFKSQNALLHNSLAFFGRFSVRPASPELGPAISAAAAAMLNLTLDTSADTVHTVGHRLDDLDTQSHAFNGGDSIDALLAHGRLLNKLLPATDGALKAMRAIPRKPGQDDLRALLLTRQIASRAGARWYRELLYATSLILVGFLIHLGVQLNARANALARRAAFEHVIAGISTRFINAPPQNIDAEIERGLAEMANCIGSDRAYFVLRGSAPRLHLWSRRAFDHPPNWPEGAPALAARFDSAAEGNIHIPNVKRLSPCAERTALATLGIGGWACVTNVNKNGTAVALGFDAIGRPCRIRTPGELGLLRMALDTIVHAVERHDMEKERTRLEAHLQQARRMEKIGTFTSGIAHNFNNILGGILGHSEVMEEHVAQDVRLVRSIAAIRRAAERARELVDQIMVFGRRRDARRRPLSPKVLVAEAASLLNVALPRGIELAIHEPSATMLVSGEPAQLQQVILNLCNNAAQAMERGGHIDVAIQMHEVREALSLTHDDICPGRYVSIAVSDHGRGMDEATQARIFEPFFTTRPSGNGLGLATAHEIVREHGGAMNVRSTLGEGSRFEVWLPCKTTVEAVSETDEPALQAGRGETVLLVTSDGKRLLRDEEMLAALGYEPVGFTTTAAALAASRAKPGRFDAAIIGHLGSTASALTLATALHAVAPQLPILLAARSTEFIAADTLVGAGIADVVRWPMIAAEIAAALGHCSVPKRDVATPIRLPRAS